MNPQESFGSEVQRGQGELRALGQVMSSTDVGAEGSAEEFAC